MGGLEIKNVSLQTSVVTVRDEEQQKCRRCVRLLNPLCLPLTFQEAGAIRPPGHLAAIRWAGKSTMVCRGGGGNLAAGKRGSGSLVFVKRQTQLLWRGQSVAYSSGDRVNFRAYVSDSSSRRRTDRLQPKSAFPQPSSAGIKAAGT